MLNQFSHQKSCFRAIHQVKIMNELFCHSIPQGGIIPNDMVT